jgi:hypothetical protein
LPAELLAPIEINDPIITLVLALRPGLSFAIAHSRGSPGTEGPIAVSFTTVCSLDIDDQVVGDFSAQHEYSILVCDDSFHIWVAVTVWVAVICRTRETIQSDGDETFLDQVFEQFIISLIHELFWDENLPQVTL